MYACLRSREGMRTYNQTRPSSSSPRPRLQYIIINLWPKIFRRVPIVFYIILLSVDTSEQLRVFGVNHVATAQRPLIRNLLIRNLLILIYVFVFSLFVIFARTICSVTTNRRHNQRLWEKNNYIYGSSRRL